MSHDPLSPEPLENAVPTGGWQGKLARFFALVVKKRWLVLALYGLLLPPSAFFAMKVGQDNDIQRIIVPTQKAACTGSSSKDVPGTRAPPGKIASGTTGPISLPQAG